ncbi:hypothetical protein LPJ78_004076 [Coemansia sp. RSA 989]|nr:hypothetical protein LPJ78_004076 [Coemansia sp. RSA 989]
MSSENPHFVLLVEEYEELLNSVSKQPSRVHERLLLRSAVAAGHALLKAYELYEQPGSLDKGAQNNVIIAKEQLFNQAQERYFMLIGSGAPQRAQKDGIFEPFEVREAIGSSSSHACKKAVYKHLFFRSKDLVPLAARFQEVCMQNTRIPDSRFCRHSPASGRLEDPFVDQVVDEMAPRLQAILENVFGLQNVSLQKLHKNSGVDAGLTAYSSDYGKLAFYLPIEVKNRFGREAPQSRLPRENVANFIANRGQVESLCAKTGNLDAEAIWHGSTQTAHYMENGVPRTNDSTE